MSIRNYASQSYFLTKDAINTYSATHTHTHTQSTNLEHLNTGSASASAAGQLGIIWTSWETAVNTEWKSSNPNECL